MYNVGIVLARGEIVAIGDSDAMVEETFIQTILNAFERDPEIVYHMDEFRNVRRNFYPFNYPSFEQMLGEGCMNNANGKTTGVLNTDDPIHTRNYGACMCARREDLITIGGADEHIDYLGHICGPYDMTFRLVNHGRREVWDTKEFLYHTWHPGQAGADNYLGPHDGRHMSTTALQALVCGRILPLVENRAVRMLRTKQSLGEEKLLSFLIRSTALVHWQRDNLGHFHREAHPIDSKSCILYYRGARIYQDGVQFSIQWMWADQGSEEKSLSKAYTSIAEACSAIDMALPRRLKLSLRLFATLQWLINTATFIGKSLRTLFRNPSVLLHRLGKAPNYMVRSVYEQKRSYSDISNLIALVVQIARKQRRTSRPIVAVHTRSDAFFLGMMRWAISLPIGRVILIQDMEAVNRYFSDPEPEEAPIILQSSVYIRFYPAFAAFRKKGFFIVV
jgi:hypothetical protein